MASRHVDVNERRLRPVYDALDSLNNKKAIQQADKILKKQKDLHCAKVLKSIALLRSGRRDECEKLMNEVKKVQTCDDATLQAMTICFREMEKHSEISEIYEVALKKSPRNEELFTHLFMSYVRTSQFKKQQQVAMNLYKMFQKNPYYFWVVMSYVLQASVCDDEHAKSNMLLPLAEKMILKFINESKIESDAEVHLYLMVLEMQNKHKIALEAINGPLAKFLSSYVNEKKKIEYLLKLERWCDVNLSYKNLIETRPGEWSNYQGYLESLTRLIEANYAPITEDSLSSAVPDYTVPMARDFIEKLKCKEIENNERRNRAPFLACLELQKKTHEKIVRTSSEGCQDDLIKLLVEYFQLFGEKSVCFSDLFMYLDLLDSTKQSEFLEMVKSSSMVSSDGNVMKNIKEMSRTITIEKFSRYLCEQEQLSSEEMIAHARHLMSMHKDGLKFGKDLLPTDFQHSDDFALLAAHLLLDCCDRSGHSRSWHRVLITLESAIKSSPSNIQLKLLVARLYCLLGAVGPCIMYMDSMEFKHILYDTLGLNVSRYAAPLGHFKSAKDFYNLALKFYQANKKDTPEYVIASYKYGSFEKLNLGDILHFWPLFVEEAWVRSTNPFKISLLLKIIEIMNFKGKLENSFFFKSILLEQKFLDVVLLANSSSSIHEILVDQKLQEDFEKSERWISKLHDNRDLELLITWNRLDRVFCKEARKTSFQHELLWLKLRLITINAVALTTTCTARGATSSAIVNHQDTDFHQMPNHTNDSSTLYRNVVQQLQDLCNEVRVSDAITKKFPLYGPLPTRWKAYLDCSYDDLLISLLNAAQVSLQIIQTRDQDDKLQECVTVIKTDLMRSLTILKDNAALCSNSLTIEDNGKQIFNGSIVESLVLLLEAISIVLVFLQNIRTIILKATQLSQSKRKKKVLPPAQKELSDAYQLFAESFCSVVSGIHDDLLDQQVLNLAEDLTTLDINVLYKLTDSSLLTEIWGKMQTSYKTSVQEISDVYKLKLDYLKTLCI